MYWTDGAKRRYSLARSAGTTVYTTSGDQQVCLVAQLGGLELEQAGSDACSNT